MAMQEHWERRQAMRARLASTAAVDVVHEVIEEDLPAELHGDLLRRLEAKLREDNPKP